MSRALARALLFVGSLLAGLLVIEVGLRVIGSRDEPRSYPDADLGWSAPAYAEFDPHSIASRPDQQRILFLGDSMILPRDPGARGKRIPEIYESLVGERGVVQTLATSGWGTDQELLAFLQKGVAYEPDVVFLMFCAYNDLSNNLSNRLSQQRAKSVKPYFRLEGTELVLYDGQGVKRSHPGEYERRSLLRRSEIVRRVEQITRGDETREPTVARVDPRYEIFKRVERPYHELHGPPFVLSWAPQATIDHLSAFIAEDFALNAYQWRLLDALIGELASRSAAIDARLVVVLLPVPIPGFEHDLRLVTGSEFRARYDTPEGPFSLDMANPARRLAAITEHHDIELFDPTTSFVAWVREQDSSEEIWLDGDPHMTGPSNRRVATELYEFTAN